MLELIRRKKSLANKFIKSLLIPGPEDPEEQGGAQVRGSQGPGGGLQRGAGRQEEVQERGGAATAQV